jgi:hypothetical protein
LNRYKLVKIIAKSKKKTIYQIKDINTSETAIAKIQELVQLEGSNERNILNEASFFQIMQGHIGIPFMQW